MDEKILNGENSNHKSKKLIFFSVFFIIWLLFILNLWLFQSGYQEFLTAIAIIISGFSTLLFWLFRNRIKELINKWDISPKAKFILIGSLCAIYIETVFWVVEKIAGFEGLAAHPNLLIDLLITMPWYVAMITLLWKVETKRKYSYLEILILGGIYDFFTDGIIGSIFSGAFSPLILVLLVILYPIFFVTYSLIVLTPSFLIENEIDLLRSETELDRIQNKWILGLYPLLGLLILIVVFFIAIILIANLILGLIVLILCVLIALCIFKKKTKKSKIL